MQDASWQHSMMEPRSLPSRSLTLAAVVIPFIATAYAIITLWHRAVGPIDLALLVGMYILTGLGITVGFHRFATHRSFRSHPFVEIGLLALGSMAVEGDVLQWVSDHWRHHKHADKP